MAGMTLGGHSHRHLSLATLTDEGQAEDLNSCHRLLTENLLPQSLWPFSYPYGKQSSFNRVTVQQLNQIGFGCSFATEVGANRPGADLFAIHRVDCKDVQC
jgi:hypothetical protein